MALTTMTVTLKFRLTEVTLHPLEGGYVPESGNGEDDITESMTIHIAGTTAQVKATIQSIERILRTAETKLDDPNYYVYLKLKMADADTEYRSRILGGKLDYTTLSVEGGWGAGNIPAVLTIRRVGYWEGDETQIALTNTNGAAVTTALPVYNCNDGSGTAPSDRVNYFYCGALEGDLEAPVILEWDANFGLSTTDGSEMWVGMWNNTRNGGVTADQLTLTYELGTDQADAAASSGGSYHRESFSDTTAAEIAEVAVTFESGFGGAWFRPLIRIKTAPTAGERFWVWWKIRKWVDTVYTDWETSGKVLVNPDSGFSYILELPPMRIPPTFVMDNDMDLAVQFWVQAEAAGSHTFDVDYVILMPMDGYRKYVRIGTMPISQYFMDEGIMGVVYDPADGSTPFVAYGEPFMVKPWEVNHLFVFVIATSTSSNIASKVGDMKLWYRPRRKSLG